MTTETAPDAPGSTPLRSTTRRGGRSIIVGWVLTRALMLVLLVAAERVALGDVNYYWRKIDALFDVGLAQTFNEYPTPVTWMLWIPYGISGGSRLGYRIAFIAVMMALDALFTWLLWRLNGRRRDTAVDFWLGFVFLVGPLCYLRFDLVPAVLAGAGLLFSRRRPGLTGVLTGIGAAIKLWPALLIGVFAAERRTRRPMLIGFLTAGLGLAVVSLLTGGLRRLLSPLTWQSDRGLQIESLWATPLMIMRAIRPTEWVVGMSRYQAYEIFGAGVDSLLTASTVASILGLVIIVALIARAFRNGDPSPVAVGISVLAIVAVMTVTNKTLSPQYLLWLGGAMAALLLIDRRNRSERPDLVRRLAIQLLVLALVTHLVYPLLYSGLFNGLGGRGGWPMIIAATVALVIRNLALLIFTVSVCAAAWRGLGRRSPTQPAPSQPS